MFNEIQAVKFGEMDSHLWEGWSKSKDHLFILHMWWLLVALSNGGSSVSKRKKTKQILDNGASFLRVVFKMRVEIKVS